MNQINFKKLFKGIGMILLYILIIPEVILFLFKTFHLNLENQNIYIWLNITTYLIMILFIFSIYKKDLIIDFNKFINRWKENLRIGFKNWLFGFLCMVFTNAIIIQLTGNIASNEAQNRSFIDIFPIISFIFMVFIGPFIEEILFRKGFKDVFKNKYLYYVFSAFLFGFAHILATISTIDVFANPLQLLYIIPYSAIGFFLAKSYIETDTIYTSTLFHTFHNAIAVCLAMLGA